jgi:hypothetical protein
MLNLATVIVTLYTYIDDYCKQNTSIKPGPSSKMTDSEIITLAMICELSGKTSEYGHIRFAKKWLRDYFPNIIDRSRYHRRLESLKITINDIRMKILKEVIMELSDLHVVDSTPVPVISFQRSYFSSLFREAEYGYCAARKMTYYGFKLHLVTDKNGIPIHFDLTTAEHSDRDITEELLEKSSKRKTVLADKGYLSEDLQKNLNSNHGIKLLYPKRKNQKNRESSVARKNLNKLRQIIEVVNGILKEQFSLEKTLAKTLSGLCKRVMNKLTALTFAIFINKTFGQNPLNICSLIP